MITYCRVILITTFFVMFFTESVNSRGLLNKEEEECRNNIYKEYNLKWENSIIKNNPRKAILLESFRFKILSDFTTDDAKDYFLVVSKNIMPNRMECPKRYCEILTIDLEIDDGIKKYFECIGKLQRYFLDSDDTAEVVKDAYLNQVESVFDSLSSNDYARIYFNYMVNQISYSHKLQTPVQFCRESRIAKSANLKKRKKPESGSKLESTSSKEVRSQLSSTSGSNKKI